MGGIDEKSGEMSKARNSRVEILRIIAMLLILMNHFLQMDMMQVACYPVRAINTLLCRLGGVGDDIFFGISAYYLCARKSDVKSSLRRSWKLEIELLFYSIVFFIIILVIGFSLNFWPLGYRDTLFLGVKSFFPVLGNLWWYPTSYVMFLFILPALNWCLKRIGPTGHGLIAIGCFAFSSFLNVQGLQPGHNVILFIYLYILISFFRWNHAWVFASFKLGALLFGVGGFVGFLDVVLTSLFDEAAAYGSFLNNPAAFPSILIALGLFIMQMSKSNVECRQVNIIASATLVPYLIIAHPWFDEMTLFEMKKGFMNFGHSSLNIVARLIAIVGFFVICVIVEIFRRKIYSLPILKRFFDFDTFFNKFERLFVPFKGDLR